MAVISGSVRFAGFIAPTDSTDTYPVTVPTWGLGGLRTVADAAERDAITSQRREVGMLVYVEDEQEYYMLGSGLTNSDWSAMNWGGQSASQVFVSATGDTTYLATGTPTVTGYTVGDIYVTTFQSGNTMTGVTINIDGVGVIPVEKYNIDVSGFTTLDIGDIQPSVNYYLSYDGSIFQFLETNPESDPGTYTNPLAVPVTLGGVEAGTIFNNTPYSAVFDDLFYPYLTPNFTSFVISSQSTILEKGNTLSGGLRTFTWTTSNPSYISPNTIKIKDISGGNVIISSPSSGITNDGSESISISPVTKSSTSIQETYVWQIRGTRTNGTQFARDYTVYWRWRMYWGTSSQTGLTSAQITGLTSNQLDTTVIGDTLSYSTGNYKYFCIPSTFAEPSLIKDSSTNLAIAMADTTEGYTAGTGTYKHLVVSVTNQYGIAQNYKVFRSRNILGGSINFIIS